MEKIRKLIRLTKVLETIGIGRSTYYTWTDEDSTSFQKDFPQKVKLSPTKNGAVAFYLDEVIAFIERRAKNDDAYAKAKIDINPSKILVKKEKCRELP